MTAVGEIDSIELVVPLSVASASIVRMTSVAIAAELGFAMDELDDVKLVMQELFALSIAADGHGRMRIEFRGRPGFLEVRGCLEPSPGRASPARIAIAGIDEVTGAILAVAADEVDLAPKSGDTFTMSKQARLHREP